MGRRIASERGESAPTLRWVCPRSASDTALLLIKLNCLHSTLPLRQTQMHSQWVM